MTEKPNNKMKNCVKEMKERDRDLKKNRLRLFKKIKNKSSSLFKQNKKHPT